MTSPRILIVDNDPRVGPELANILEPRGYTVAIAQGSGANLLERAMTLARDSRPHVAIVDLRLLNEYTDDRSGLQAAQSLGVSARCILYSAYLTPEATQEALKKYGAAACVSKSKSPQLLLDAIAEALHGNCAWCASLSVISDWTSRQIVQTLFGAGTLVPPQSADDVMTRLFPDNKALALNSIEGQSPQVSRGHSIVLKAQPDDLEPVVVKFAPADKIQNEVSNYHAHIKDRLAGRFHAQLERAVGFWDLGAAAYSFLDSSLNSLRSFAVFYQDEAEPQVILRPLRNFFTKVWGRHYSHPLSDMPASLFPLYDKVFHLTDRLGRFSNQNDKIVFPGLPVSLTNPVAWTLQHAGASQMPGIRLAVTHGDLHGDNLFVDGEHAWTIDFERTGPGHILRDFVELEVDIATRLALFLDNDLSRFYELAVVLAGSAERTEPSRPASHLPAEPETRKALEVIVGLRALAREMTHYSDSREYLWGLLLDSLFVATLVPSESPQHQRALLLGALLCECLNR